MRTKAEAAANPLAGDRWRLDTGGVLRLTNRSTMHPHAYEKHGIRGGSEFFTYSLDRYIGITFYQSVTGMKKRLKNAEFLGGDDD